VRQKVIPYEKFHIAGIVADFSQNLTMVKVRSCDLSDT